MAALKQLTIGIVGFGRIGREVVRRLLAFKARVLVFDPVVPAGEIEKAGGVPVASFDDLLAQSDVVSPHCPSTPKTKKMFNSNAFAKMKAGARFLNVGRGDLADSDAVTAALQSGHLGGAALDVFDPEPIPTDHPIRRMPNVILAAHIASVSAPAVRTLRETAARLALAAIRGEALPNIVNGVDARS
jgi:D-3-phosphoglycerate dehydrogenase